MWQTEIGNYGSFFALLPPPLLKTQQIRNLKKWRKKNCWRYHHFTYVYQKHNHMRYGSWNTEWDKQNILSSWVIFYPLQPAKSKFWKNEKSNCICYHFTHVYHKSWSYDICFLRYKARQDFLSFWAIFCPLTLLTTRKIKILKKWHKHAWRYYHCTHVYHKWQSHEVWFLRYGPQWAGFFVILHHFLPLYPPNNLENQNFEKTKKKPGCILILHICTINDNLMMYGSWDMERKKQNFLSFWTVFCPFTSPKDLENENFGKTKKKAWRHYHFTRVPYMTIIWYMVPEIWSETDKICCHFGLFFALLPP